MRLLQCGLIGLDAKVGDASSHTAKAACSSIGDSVTTPLPVTLQ